MAIFAVFLVSIGKEKRIKSNVMSGSNSSNGGFRVPVSFASHDFVNIRASDLTVSNLRLVFGISESEMVYLVDEERNVEFADGDGVFGRVERGKRYMVRRRGGGRRSVRREDNKEEDVAGGGRGAEEDPVDWNCSTLMDISKGEGGKAGSQTYVAENGVIVHASAPVYNCGGNYYMGHMFNGNTNSKVSTNYWLPILSSNKKESLLFTFTDDINLSHINICATGCYENNSQSDRVSNYNLSVYSSLHRRWFPITDGFIDTINDPHNKVRCHEVKMKNISKVKVEVDRQKTFHAIKEIDFYVV